jgi:glycosyltransferase involved in cell wall biosynthesis
MTAGCIYPLGCRKYLEGCGNCPQLGDWPLLTHRDRTAAMERERRHVMKAGRIHLIAPSEWMRRQIHAKHPDAAVEVIYNGVNTSTFSPFRRSLKVGVATTRSPTLSVLFVANYSREVRKGSLYIPEMIEWLRDNDRRLRLVIVGEAPRTGVEQLGPLKIHSVGHIATRERLAELYANVDAVLMLSHADNCPLVVLEALACGTPVFAFATGGIPELVDENAGALSSPGALAELLVQLFDRAEAGKLEDMSTAARERAERHYTMSRFLGDHADYYGRVVSSVR